MCSICKTCSVKTECYCEKCPHYTGKIDPQCNICGIENCSDVYCGIITHVETSGQLLCLKCLEIEYKIEFRPAKRMKSMYCEAHQVKNNYQFVQVGL